MTTSPPFITKEHVLEQAYVGRRVAGDRDQVGVQAGLDPADPVRPPHQLGCVDGGRPDRLDGRLAVPDVVGELAGVLAVRVDAAVGAVGDPDAGGDALLEGGALGEGGLVVLAQHVGLPAVLPSELGDVVAAVDVGDQPGARLGHHRDAFVVHQGPVLDRVHPGPDRPLDPLGAVCVGRHVRAVQSGLLDGGPDLGLAQLGHPGVRPVGHHRSGGDQLDQVGTAVQDPTYRAGHVVDGVDHAHPQLRGHMLIGVGRETADVAPAATAPDEGAGHHHPRTRRPACVDRVAQRDVDEGAVVADVAHAGEPGAQRRACVAHAGHRLLRAGAREQLGVALPAVDLAHEVGVTVDQAGQQRRARQVEDVASVGASCAATTAAIRSPSTTTARFVSRSPVDDVEQPIGTDDEGAGHARRLWCSGSGTRVVPQAARGAPSQQLAFMWQCGHSHRVEMGSNSTPQ